MGDLSVSDRVKATKQFAHGVGSYEMVEVQGRACKPGVGNQRRSAAAACSPAMRPEKVASPTDMPLE